MRRRVLDCSDHTAWLSSSVGRPENVGPELMDRYLAAGCRLDRAADLRRHPPRANPVAHARLVPPNPARELTLAANRCYCFIDCIHHVCIVELGSHVVNSGFVQQSFIDMAGTKCFTTLTNRHTPRRTHRWTPHPTSSTKKQNPC